MYIYLLYLIYIYIYIFKKTTFLFFFFFFKKTTYKRKYLMVFTKILFSRITFKKN